MDKTKLEITVKGNRLFIQGERTNGSGDKDSYHRREREMGSFKRTVALPEQLDAEKTAASYDSGVLQIVCPRAAGAKAHRIKVD